MHIWAPLNFERKPAYYSVNIAIPVQTLSNLGNDFIRSPVIFLNRGAKKPDNSCFSS